MGRQAAYTTRTGSRGSSTLIVLSAEDKHDLFRDLKSDDEKTRRYAMRTLSHSVSPREVAAFIRRLRPYQWQGKIGACTVLARIGGEESIDILLSLLVDFNPQVRQSARKALGKLGVKKPYTDDEVVELVSYLEHPSWWVRVGAIKNLALIRDRRALEPISQLLMDEDDTVREASKQALAAIKKKT
jgi:HEAT repeat protein